MKKHTVLAMVIIALHFTGRPQESGNPDLGTVNGVESYIYSDALTGERSKKAFRSIKRLSEEGDVRASCLLGVLYKDGTGTRPNFNRARKQFKSAYGLGSGKAAYSLGYLYLKGLGNIGQDYQKAIHWFEKSDWPMARHWLAKMHYHGHGVPVDRQKGMDLLRANPIGNSQVLLSQWEHDTENPKSAPNTTVVIEDPSVLGPGQYRKGPPPSSFGGLGKGIVGTWSGEWRIMDWSEEKTMRNIPISIEISEDGTGLLHCSVQFDGKAFTGEIVLYGNEIVFPDMTITLRKDYTDHPSETALDYRLASFTFKLGSDDTGQAMNGNLEATIVNWSEPAPPSRLALRREGLPLGQEALDALAGQSEHFIKVYPNPFAENLLLHYTLEQDSRVSAQLLDYYRPSKVLRAKQAEQKKGERTMVFDGLDVLKSGLYIINMNVGAARYSRIVVRK